MRVHAGKLRKLLTLYYETEGLADPWRIEIPKGGYTPVYHRQSTALPLTAEAPSVLALGEVPRPQAEEPVQRPSAASPEEKSGQPSPRQEPPTAEMQDAPTVALAAPPPLSPTGTRATTKLSPVAALSILPLMLLLPLSSTAMSVHVPPARLTARAVADTVAGELPHLHVKLRGEASRRAQQFSTLLGLAFAQYRTINAATLPTIEVAGPVKPDEKLSFDVEVSEQQTPDGLVVTVRNGADGDVVSTAFIPGHAHMDENDLLFESLEMASANLTPDGAIFRYAADKGIESHLMRCVRLTDEFRLSRSRETFRQMRDCQQRLIPGPDGKMIFAVSAGALSKAISDGR